MYAWGKKFKGGLLQNIIGGEAPKTGTAIISVLATATTGAGTFFEVLPAVLGSLASITGILISLCIFYLTYKKNRLERKRLLLQIDVLRAESTKRNSLPY